MTYSFEKNEETQFTDNASACLYFLRANRTFEAGIHWERARHLSWKIHDSSKHYRAQRIVDALRDMVYIGQYGKV